MRQRKEALRMDTQITETAIKAFVEEIVELVEQAASVAKAAQACADAGNVGKAVQIALGIEEPLYEANALLNAASLIKRIDSR